MHIRIGRDELLKGLERIRGLTRKDVMPILAHALFTTDDGDLVITASDLEATGVGRYSATVLEGGPAVIQAQTLFEIVKTLSGELEIKVDAKGATVISGKSKYKVPVMPPADYPAIPTMQDAKYFEFPKEILAKMIGRAIYAINERETRYTMTGLYLSLKGNGEGYADVLCAATDGHRLSKCADNVPVGADDGDTPIIPGIIIPKKALFEIARLLKAADPTIAIAFDKQLSIQAGDFSFVTRLMEGQFPNYEQIIPRDNGNVLTVKTAALMEAIKRAAVFSQKAVFGLATGKLAITTPDEGTGTADDEIEVEYSGPEMIVGFNIRYLIEALSVIDGPDISMAFADSGAMHPVLITDKADDTTLHLIMPMRVQA